MEAVVDRIFLNKVDEKYIQPNNKLEVLFFNEYLGKLGRYTPKTLFC